VVVVVVVFTSRNVCPTLIISFNSTLLAIRERAHNDDSKMKKTIQLYYVRLFTLFTLFIIPL
jgi:hypothetical protein